MCFRNFLSAIKRNKYTLVKSQHVHDKKYQIGNGFYFIFNFMVKQAYSGNDSFGLRLSLKSYPITLLSLLKSELDRAIEPVLKTDRQICLSKGSPGEKIFNI